MMRIASSMIGSSDPKDVDQVSDLSMLSMLLQSAQIL
jgi:hypothetical protein